MGSMHRALAVGATAVGIAAGVCGLVAPRLGNDELARAWEDLRLFRYAHRGLHDNRTFAPENSLAAFRLARDAGYGSELDVHLSADGVPVVIHDYDLNRACRVGGRVEGLTSGEIGELRLFGTAEHVPTLGQVLDVYEGGEGACPPLIVEVKTTVDNVSTLMEAVMATLDEHAVPFCLESFDPRALWWLRWHRPEVLRGQLSEDFTRDPDSELGPVTGRVLSALMGNGMSRPDFIAYRFEDRRHPSVRLACDLLGGHRVYWTVHNEDELDVCDEEGAVAIFEGFEP